MIRFPENVSGWLSESEGVALSVFAHGRNVLEIGSYEGRSTVCIAQTARRVTSVDPFDGRGTPEPRDTFETFKQNLSEYGVSDKVTVHRGTINDIGPSLEPEYDLVFIDGAHDYGSVRSDTEWALRLLKPGGLIAYHDYRNKVNPGVDRAVDDLLADGGVLLHRVNSLALVRPPDELVVGEAERRKVVLVMPNMGSIRCSAASDAFSEYPTRRDLDLMRFKMASSVTTLNFNRLWCEALNLRASGFTHFVMLHDDVCPEPGWLDVLMDEIDEHDADVVSAVVPLKSIHGLTSTALGWGPPHGSIFRPLRRVTMHEAFTLPETFSREDVHLDGPPILFVNTGCWIADLRKPWVEQNVFRNFERNIRIGGRWKADCMSEDWAFSVDLHRWGAKVLATRKVSLYHGRQEFHNKAPWGAWQDDEEYFERTRQTPQLAVA